MSQLASHSADVEMWLECDPYGRIDLSRITPKAVVAKLPRKLPPCHGKLIVVIDGDRLETPVSLPAGFGGGAAAMIRLITDDVPF